jgi:membrane protease YdiL (CAAX protease family)
MNKKITLTGANIVFFIFTAVFMVYQIVLAVLLGQRMNDYIYAVILVNEFVMILGPVLIYCFVKKINIKEAFRFNKPGLLPMLLVLLISVPAYFVASMLNNVLAYFLQFIGDLPVQPIPVPKNLPELVVGILIIGASPGICEEIMHRGFMLRAYEKRGSYKAVIFVAILFGIFHFDITNFFGPVFLGLIIGYYVIRTNSIFAGMLAHFLNNAIAEVLQYFTGQGVQPDKLTISWPELLEVLLLGFAGLILTAVLLIVFKKVTDGKSQIIPPISKISRDITAIFTHWPVILVVVVYILMMLLYFMVIVATKYLGI